MKSRIYWGLAILIILLIGVSVVMLTQTTDTEPEFIYKDVEPTARPGYILVPHGDHYHEVPISEANQVNTFETPLSSQKDVSVPVLKDTLDTSTSAADAVSDDVPHYTELEAMTDEELQTLLYATYDKLAKLSPQLNKAMDDWTEASPGSDLEKSLSKKMHAIAGKYHRAQSTGHQASELLSRRFIDYHSNLPDYPGKMTIILPSD